MIVSWILVVFFSIETSNRTVHRAKPLSNYATKTECVIASKSILRKDNSSDYICIPYSSGKSNIILPPINGKKV